MEHAERTPTFQLTGDPMPQRILKPLLAFIMPTDPPHWTITLLLSILGGLATWYVGLPPMTQILGLAMLGDYLTGVEAAEYRGEWQWRKGIRGILSKLVIGCLDLILLKITKIAGGGDAIYNTLTVALCVNEGKSVLDNLRKRGYELDTIFDAVLSRFKPPGETRIGTAPSNQDQKKEG